MCLDISRNSVETCAYLEKFEHQENKHEDIILKF